MRTKLTVGWFLLCNLLFPVLAYLYFNPVLMVLGIVWAWLVLVIGQQIAAHRYFVHTSFEASKLSQVVMNFMMTIGFQGTSQDWIISHSYHHRFADTDTDPTNVKKIGYIKNYTSLWQLESPVSNESLRLSIRSLKNPITKFFFNHYYHIWVLWAILLLSISTYAFVWFFFLPVLFSHWFMNLQNHLGHRSDVSTVINIITPGDGYHKYHHENPREYRFGKYDLIAYMIDKLFINNKR
jgi:stearoyl-CoA desaturase (delta-9 desaturase)